MYRPINDPSEQPYYSKDPLWLQAFHKLTNNVCEPYYFRRYLQDWYHALTAGQRVGSHYLQMISDEESSNLCKRMHEKNAGANVFNHAMYTVSNSMVQRNMHYANEALGYGKGMKEFRETFNLVEDWMVPLIYIMIHDDFPYDLWEKSETFY